MELDNDNNDNELEMKDPGQSPPNPNPQQHEHKDMKENKDDNNNNNNRQPGPPHPEPEDSVPMEAHDNLAIRNMIRSYHTILRAQRATLQRKNIIENQMVNWNELGILRWVTNNMPAAVPMVERGAGRFAKVELVLHAFRAANKANLEMIEEVRNGLIGMGVLPEYLGIPADVFDEEEQGKDEKDGTDGTNGQDGKDGDEDDREMTPKEGSESQYRPPGGKEKSKRKGKGTRRRKVTISKHTTYVDGAVSNVEKKKDDDEQDTDDDMDPAEKLKRLKEKVARKDAEIEKLKEKEKELKKKKMNDDVKVDPAVLSALNKAYGNRGKKVSYSGVIVITFFLFFCVSLLFFLGTDA